MRTHLHSKEPQAVATLVALLGCLRLLFLWLKPDGELVKHIPDDAFYYLVPARNFATLGRWTFDGVEPATGFHLLWGYFLVALLKINPALSLHTIFAVAGLVQVACLAGAAFLLTRRAVQLFGRGAGWGAVTVFLSSTMLVQGGWLMESAFVIALAALLVDLLARTSLPGRTAGLATAMLIGWLLELARSDAGLLAALLLLMHFVLWRQRVVDRSMPIAAAFALTGAVLGIATILIHTHAVSGGWIQASAQQKLFWSKIGGHVSLRSVAGTPLSVLQPLHYAVPHYSRSTRLLHLSSVVGHLLGFAVALVVLAGAVLAGRRAGKLAGGLLVTMGVLLVAYCLFYQHDGALFDWYISNFAVSMTLIAAAATAWSVPRAPTLTAIACVLLASAGFGFSLVPNAPWQECMYRAGIFLRDHRLAEGQGAFNSGIVGFFAGGSVTNLDGLVNDRILPYAVEGRLADYMAQRRIAYVFDSPYMLQNAVMQQRGGYADGRLVRCLQSAIDTFPEDVNNTWEDTHIHLSRFDLACLRQAATP